MRRFVASLIAAAAVLSLLALAHSGAVIEQLYASTGCPLSNTSWRFPQLPHALVIWVYNPINCSNCMVRVIIGDPAASYVAGNGSYRLLIDNVVDVTNESIVAYAGGKLVIAAPMNFSSTDALHYIVLYYGSNESVGRSVLIDRLPIIVSTGTRSNASIAVPIEVPNMCTTPSCSDLGFVENGTPLRFWLVRVNSSSAIAVVWLNISLGSAVIDAVYNSSLGSYNTTSFIPFLDTFETWSGWTQHGYGVVSQSSATAFQGRYSLLKNSYADPNGGYKALPFNVTSGECAVLYAWINRTTFSSANFDRIGLIDASGNGYGISVGLQNNEVGIDKRSSYTGTTIASVTAPLSSLIGKWYLARVAICLGNTTLLYASVANTGNTQILGYVNATDSSRATTVLQRVYVFGGYPYYVDAMMVFLEPPVAVNATARVPGEPPKSFGVAEVANYVPPVTPTVTATQTVTTTSVSTTVSTSVVTSTRYTSPPTLVQSLSITQVLAGTIAASAIIIAASYFIRRASIRRY